MSEPVHVPRTRQWHYAESDRLLHRAAEVTKEFTEITGTSNADMDKQARLATLGGMLTRRANVHASLAIVSQPVAQVSIAEAEDRWIKA